MCKVADRLRRIAELDLGMAAPRQEGRVILAAIHQLEHALGGLLDQHCLFNLGHAAAAFLYPVELAILMDHPAA
jgi:S-ribosylhomocysteine lyase LuxS involved in autoinducer biosynthesis